MRHLDLDTRRAVLATLTSAVATSEGPTPEQRRFLDALADHVLDVTDDPGRLEPADASTALPDPVLRRLVAEGLIALELMCHPASPALTERVATYLEALGADDAEQQLARDHLADARDRVAADWERIQVPTGLEAQVVGASDAETLALLERLADCPPGSLGRSFHDFYHRHRFPLPIGHESLIGHDFAHVLAGYEPTPEGEIALQAFLTASTDGAQHFSGLLASLLLFEVGLMTVDDLEPKVAVLDRPGAAELFADAINRGQTTGSDIQALDHFALAERDLVALRAELGIPAPVGGPFTFVV